MSKIDKEEAGGLMRGGEDHLGVVEYSIQQLPRTPGRDIAQRGIDEVRRGLQEIKREAEL